MGIKLDGKVFNIPGYGDIHLYPIKKLSNELSRIGVHRSTQTIRNWINNGIIPRSIFYLGKVSRKSMFSKEQINVIVKLAKKHNLRQGKKIAETNFSVEVKAAFDALNKKYLQGIGGSINDCKKEEKN